jgi:hypothetical protein
MEDLLEAVMEERRMEDWRSTFPGYLARTTQFTQRYPNRTIHHLLILVSTDFLKLQNVNLKVMCAILWMRSSRVGRERLAVNANAATVLGSLPSILRHSGI